MGELRAEYVGAKEGSGRGGAEAESGVLCRERKGNMGELRVEYVGAKEGSGRGGAEAEVKKMR